MDDWQLLQDYAQSGSESAFNGLIERHLNLVYSSALRQVSDPHLAQEITQAVFILLARKADTLQSKVVLSGWLFRTTRFVASRTLRAELRRRRRDQEAYQMQNLSTSDDAWKQIAPFLDEALEKLSEGDRNAVLLRFAEAKNHKEVGARLGLSEEAARKRVDRALGKLRGFFGSHGFTVSATVLASALANSVQAAPESLGGAVKSAVLASAVSGSTLPALVAQTLNAWRWAKLKIAASLVLLGIGVTVLVGVAHVRLEASSGRATSQIEAPTSTANKNTRVFPTIIPEKATALTPANALRLLVIEKSTGDPVTNALIAVNMVTGGKWVQGYDLFTDVSGKCDVPLPPDLGRLDVGILSSGWQARYATFRDGVPQEYLLRVDRATNRIGGWLQDESGKSVANAKIQIQFGDTTDFSGKETPRERRGFIGEAPAAISDSKGYWSCSLMSRDNNPGFDLHAIHPDFAATELCTDPSDADQLWKGTLVSRLKRGISLTGHVLDKEGHPVAGARIMHNPSSDKPINTTTDAKGQFTIPNLPPSDFDFTVMAEGFGPQYRKLSFSEAPMPVEVRLDPGALLRLRIVDENGEPVPQTEAILEQWGEIRQVLPWRATSGPDGRIEWNSAPPRETLELCAMKSGWCYTRGINVVADGQEHLITLFRELKLSCYVTDAQTGDPISEFKAFPGYGEGNGLGVWERSDTKKGLNGQVEVNFTEARKPWRVGIEADGYEPAISEPLRMDSVGTLEISLKRGKPIRGHVLLPDGHPAVNAQVVALTPDYDVDLDPDTGKFRHLMENVVSTDESGAFSFPSSKRVHTLAAVSLEGFVKQAFSDPKAPVVLQLQAWGRVEGTVAESVRRWPIEKVLFWNEPAMEYHGSVHIDLQSALNDGKFIFEKVPAGAFSLLLDRGIRIPFSCRTEIKVLPGQTSYAQIGGKGRAVLGKIDVQPGAVRDSQGNRKIFAMLKKPDAQPFPRATGKTGDAAALWAASFWQSEQGRQYLLQRAPGVWVGDDGSLRAEEVLPGTYKLTIIAPGARFEKELIIPADGLEDIDLGTIHLQ